MISVKSLERREIDANLVESIVALDVANMTEFFARLGLEVPVARRRSAFEHPGTVVVAMDEAGSLAGYLEYGPGWDSRGETYVSSIQIAEEHQKGPLLLRLLRHAFATCDLPAGQAVGADVQESNPKAMRLLERLGFHLDDGPARRGTRGAWMRWQPRSSPTRNASAGT
ncbi:MAG: GNAT family N-acetyltransferase [Luteolibacter sp.]